MNKIQQAWNAVKSAWSVYKPGFAMVIGSSFAWGFKTKSSQLTEGYRNKIVYATVNVLTRKLLEAPLIVSKVVDEKSNRKTKSFNFSQGNETGKYNVLRAKALEELDKHDLIDLLNEPNPYQVGMQMMDHFWHNYELTGDGYIWAELSDFGRNEGMPVFLHSLQADRVVPYREGGDWRDPITYYTFTTWDGTQVRIDPSEIMHMTKWSPLDPILGGMSPQLAGGLTIAKNNANEVAQGSAFQNGGTGTIIGSDSLVVDGKQYYKLNAEQVTSIKNTVQNDWAGASNSGKIHVTNGMVNVQKLGDTLVDLNAIEANKEDVQAIAGLWGVNSVLLGDKSGGTENNVSAAYKALVTNVIVTELRMFDMMFKRFSKNWYKNENLDVSHDLTEFSELAPDLKLMKEVYGDAWYISGNEKRKIFNMDQGNDPILDKYLIPSSLTPSDMLTEQDFSADAEQGKQYNDYN